MFRTFLLILTISHSLQSFAGDAEFLKRPPISSKCNAMLDKKEELEEALGQSRYLIDRAEKFRKTLKYDRRSSQARILGLRAKLEMKRDEYQKKYDRHQENIIKEGCPSL